MGLFSPYGYSSSIFVLGRFTNTTVTPCSGRDSGSLSSPPSTSPYSAMDASRSGTATAMWLRLPSARAGLAAAEESCRRAKGRAAAAGRAATLLHSRPRVDVLPSALAGQTCGRRSCCIAPARWCGEHRWYCCGEESACGWLAAELAAGSWQRLQAEPLSAVLGRMQPADLGLFWSIAGRGSYVACAAAALQGTGSATASSWVEGLQRVAPRKL